MASNVNTLSHRDPVSCHTLLRNCDSVPQSSLWGLITKLTIKKERKSWVGCTQQRKKGAFVHFKTIKVNKYCKYNFFKYPITATWKVEYNINFQCLMRNLFCERFFDKKGQSIWLDYSLISCHRENLKCSLL